ncbi:sarcosine oxidase subunit alpha [Rugosimonospora africana]|uniref:Sarcosine oxidase subunit alpha n=1 Tax=Rugosimonospora africana TaxID=556532 RepID=A0A8J3QW99_9ACTN|nr:sarcosine oxidase subunit alpha [Rugosimonospora africana]
MLRFRFDGTAYSGHPGDTLASALLANGVRRIGTSVRLGRPRGVMSAGSEEPTGVVQLEAPFPDPMRPATMVELHDGLVASSLSGRGRLADRPDPARYDAVHAHCDMLVVGAGPAGLAAASLAVRSGARVILADERPEVGGASPDTEGDDWFDRAGARVLTRTTVFGYYDDNYLVAVERRTDHLGAAAPGNLARERIWRIRAGQVVLATGAHERPIAFAGNDLPGVMLADSARTYLHRYGVLVGRRAVVFTINDSGYRVVADLAAAGVEIAALVDPREATGGTVGGQVGGRYGGHVVVAAHGDDAHGHDVLSTVDIEPVGGGPTVRVDADALLVSGGWSPVLHLYSQSGGRLRYDEVVGAFLPDGCRQAVTVAGAARGLTSTTACLVDGVDAARQALTALGITPVDWSPPSVGAGAEGPPPATAAPGGVPDLRFVPAEDYSTHFVDFQRDVTVADVLRATGAGLRSVEHVKRYTTAGTAHDQGKTSGLLTSAVVGQALDAGIAELGHTTFRPPYTPVSFAALAGRDRGQLYDPVRVTAIHDWHVRHGARFEDVGQWRRSWYYPAEGEGLAEAVRRECVAARTGVAFMDASTLGKIEVQGPDAGRFLDRLYTNVMSTLAVGAIRYGVMCGLDGMVFDDGTVARLAPDRFLLTTTTGNAGPVLDWMEEWLQTEWPDLAAWCTSVTDQWATVAVVGPRSRDVLARLAPGLAVDAATFPFMTWRDTVVAGLPARVCRISFSGELAYEVNVAWWHGLALWEAVYEAGAPYGITPYGTETMHVLRAEKGYPIVGQDTDGTVTPQDLGMAWVVSKKKADFIGKRSFARSDTARPDRKHLVGLLPEDPTLLLPEGVHVVDPACLAGGRLPEPPVPMLGHVTSSYRSAALDRTFALALVAGGRDRIGDRLYAPLDDGRLVPVTVAGPVLYDPEGARRDG